MRNRLGENINKHRAWRTWQVRSDTWFDWWSRRSTWDAVNRRVALVFTLLAAVLRLTIERALVVDWENEWGIKIDTGLTPARGVDVTLTVSLKMSTTTRAMPVSGWQSDFSFLLVQQGNSGISRRNARHSTRVRPLVETLSVIFSV